MDGTEVPKTSEKKVMGVTLRNWTDVTVEYVYRSVRRCFGMNVQRPNVTDS